MRALVQRNQKSTGTFDDDRIGAPRELLVCEAEPLQIDPNPCGFGSEMRRDRRREEVRIA
jgi:hypothetical protein